MKNTISTSTRVYELASGFEISFCLSREIIGGVGGATYPITLRAHQTIVDSFATHGLFSLSFYFGQQHLKELEYVHEHTHT